MSEQTYIFYPSKAATAVRGMMGMRTYALVTVVERGHVAFTDAFPYSGVKLGEMQPLLNYPDGVRA